MTIYKIRARPSSPLPAMDVACYTYPMVKRSRREKCVRYRQSARKATMERHDMAWHRPANPLLRLRSLRYADIYEGDLSFL